MFFIANTARPRKYKLVEDDINFLTNLAKI